MIYLFEHKGVALMARPCHPEWYVVDPTASFAKLARAWLEEDQAPGLAASKPTGSALRLTAAWSPDRGTRVFPWRVGGWVVGRIMDFTLGEAPSLPDREIIDSLLGEFEKNPPSLPDRDPQTPVDQLD